jgi:hypothetical protein
MHRIIFLVLFSIFVSSIFCQYKVSDEDYYLNFSSVSFELIDTNEILKNKAKFYNFLKTLEKDVKGKNQKKELKQLYEKIHNAYFVKYAENPEFIEIFRTGQYNCVTASALYTLVFEYFKIPYEIREMPTHVYVLAYPKEHNIVIESTMPAAGVIELQKKEIEALKNSLIENKIATKSEVDEKGFFNKFLKIDSIISKNQLNAIQNYNLAVKLCNEKKYVQALDRIIKANDKYNSFQIQGVYEEVLRNLTADEKYMASTENKCFVFESFYNLMQNEDDINERTRSFLFETIVNKPIANNLKELKYYKNCINLTLKESNINKEINRLLNLFIAEVNYNNSETDSSLYFLNISYDSTKVETFPFINTVIAKKYQEIANTDSLIKTVNEFEKIYPHSKKDKVLRSVKIAAFMSSIYTEFELNKYDKANRLFEEFKKVYKPSDGNIYHQDAIGAGFGAASAYQVRKDNYSKAIEILKEGLKYAPNSLELRRKLDLIEDK